MDKDMLYHDLMDSAEGDGYFSKAIIPFSDADCEAYIRTLKELETEGKILLKEGIIKEDAWSKVVVMKGYII